MFASHLAPSPSTPSYQGWRRWWLAGHRLATILLVSIGLFWFAVLGIAGILYGWVVPNIDSLRPRIEAYASERLGTKLSIGSITATSHGWRPTFDAQKVTADHLQLARIQVSVSPLSLLRGALDQVVIDAPQVDVERSASGVVSVAGFALQSTGKSSPALDWLLSQGEIVVRGGTVQWRDHRVGNDTSPVPKSIRFTNVAVTLQGALSSHAIWVEATPEKAYGKTLQFKAQFDQPLRSRPSQWQDWTGRVYAQWDKPKLSPFLAALWPVLSPALDRSSLEDASVVAAWVDVANAQIVRVHAKATSLALLADDITVSYDRQRRSAKLKATHILWAGVAPFIMQKMDSSAATWMSELPKDGRIEQLDVTLQDWDGAKQWGGIAGQARFANSDGLSHVKAKWQPRSSQLELDGTLSRLDLTALHRYLPPKVPASVRQFLQKAVERGEAQDVQFKFKGLLNDLPSQLRVTGRLEGVQFAFSPQWPSLTQSRAQLQWQGTNLTLHQIDGQLADLPVQGTLRIADLQQPTVEVAFDAAKVPIAAALSLVARTPIQDWTHSFFAKTKGTGVVAINALLTIPLTTPQHSTIAGQLTLQGNDLQLSPSMPPLGAVRGQVAFTQLGVNLHNIRAQALGAELMASGNLDQIIVQGTATVQGLQQWTAMPASAKVALDAASGSAAYQLQIQPLNKNGPRLRIESDLAGLALKLPAPLDKPAQAQWPLVYEHRTMPSGGQRMAVSVQGLLDTQILAQGGHFAGYVAVGQAAVQTLPFVAQAQPQGLMLSVELPRLDVSAWQQALKPVLAAVAAEPTLATLPAPSLPLPTQISAYVQEVVWNDRHFEKVVLGASLTNSSTSPVWRINAQANDFSGYAEYKASGSQPDDGKGLLYARLTKLTIPDTNSQARIEQLLDAPQINLPNLDIVVDDFELTGKKLGRLEVMATNARSKSQLTTSAADLTVNEWRLQKLVLTNPDAHLSATGVWSKPKAAESAKVDVQFNWQLDNSGDLLTRLGMPDVLKGGRGLLQGRVGWLGSPMALHYPTLTGQIKLDVMKGQFLKVDPGVGRLLSVLSLQALPRLLTLDFRDVFSEGFAFDGITGDAQIKEGVLSTQNLQMKSVLALVSIHGSANIAQTTQNLHVLVLPDVNAGGASLIATLINPIAGAVSYLAQLVLRRPVLAAATKAYTIEGTWRNPVVTSVSPSPSASRAPSVTP